MNDFSEQVENLEKDFGFESKNTNRKYQGFLAKISSNGDFGFVFIDDKRIFCHINAFINKPKKLYEGKIEFDIQKTQKGFSAINIKYLKKGTGNNELKPEPDEVKSNDLGEKEMEDKIYPTYTLLNQIAKIANTIIKLKVIRNRKKPQKIEDIDYMWHKNVESYNYNFNILFNKLNPTFKFNNSHSELNKMEHHAWFEFLSKYKFDNNLMLELKKRFDKRNKELCKIYKNHKVVKLKVHWRLISGLGNTNFYETGMTLHHILGIPYLPGSSVKGILRNYFVNEVLQKFLKTDNINELDKLLDLTFDKEKIDKNSLKEQVDKLKISEELKKEVKESIGKDNRNKLILAILIFGNNSQKGDVLFLDAFPIGEVKFKLDLMNPHYPDYYDDKQNIVYPTDYQSPRPIPFLTLDEDTEFEFPIFSKDKEILDKVEKYLTDALIKYGIGAKTAVNYGYFKNENKGENKNE